MLELEFLEYPITTACNLNCSLCDHAAGIIPPAMVPAETVFSDLSAMVDIIHVDTFKITGGEALLHPDIFNILYFLKKSGLCRKVDLLTNGIELSNMDDRIWKYIDILTVSIYPGVTPSLSTPMIIAKCLAEKVYPEIKIISQHFKRLHCTPDLPERTERVFNTCKIRSAWGCHAVCQGLFYLCSVSQIIPGFLAVSGVKDIPRTDAVPLFEVEEIKELLFRCTPLEVCAYCSGTSGALEYHQQRKR
jgi:hypothetical protein